jgi:hypothetical protein
MLIDEGEGVMKARLDAMIFSDVASSAIDVIMQARELADLPGDQVQGIAHDARELTALYQAAHGLEARLRQEFEDLIRTGHILPQR